MNELRQARPVYVLGAGFSKAISDAMPITDQLGAELAKRLGGEVDFDLQPGQSFEDWLTLQITPMPFLEGYVNGRRASQAARVIAEIARVLDERVEQTSGSSCPIWLRQLIALWDAERAVVLTFNYDTLLERAVNANRPVVGLASGMPRMVQGDHVVFPAPPATQAQFAGDVGAAHTAESFQVLKLHGSLTWYWASGDSNGSTLVRVREKRGFGAQDFQVLETDFAGAMTLDRYLIPPVTSKDGYYGSYLANSLWRSARALIESAASLTTIGYSLPSEDRVTSQLIAEVDPSITISVVDRKPGTIEVRGGVLHNLARLGLKSQIVACGETCVADFAATKVGEAAARLSDVARDTLNEPSVDVVIAMPGKMPRMALLAWDTEESKYVTYPFDVAFLRDKSTSLRGHVVEQWPARFNRYSEVVTSSRLAEIIAGGKSLEFTDETGERLVAVAIDRIAILGRDVVQVKWAPLDAKLTGF